MSFSPTPRVWFTADTHFGHDKIRVYSKRPFATVEEMDRAMVDRWNSIVQPGDLVYHLGDFGFGHPSWLVEIARSLNGQKYLVFGNHDRRVRTKAQFTECFVWAKDYAEIKFGDALPNGRRQKIVLMHYALRTWNSMHYGAWQLHGHSHGTLADTGQRSLDVGVDCWDFFPVPLATIRNVMATRGFSPVDHHRTDEPGALTNT